MRYVHVFVIRCRRRRSGGWTPTGNDEYEWDGAGAWARRGRRYDVRADADAALAAAGAKRPHGATPAAVEHETLLVRDVGGKQGDLGLAPPPG